MSQTPTDPTAAATEQGAEQPPVPEITEGLLAHARTQPGSWVYVVDPALEPGGQVPPEGVVGAWRVDDNGELVEPFKHNPKYRPTPPAQGWESPTDALDMAAQWAAAGWASRDQVAQTLGEVEFHLLAPDESDAAVVVLGHDGHQEVHLFSHPDHAPAGEEIVVARLADLTEFADPRMFLMINPGSAGAYRLSADWVIDESSEDGA